MYSTDLRMPHELREDGVLPKGVRGYGDDERFSPNGFRFFAIERVLCRLPQEQYDLWKAQLPVVAWFIPEYGLWGQVDNFPNKKIIYLSPFLECGPSESAIIGLVVHEIAHVLLDHIRHGLSWAEKETEADAAIRSWGFTLEADCADKELFAYWAPPRDGQDLQQTQADAGAG